jgi:DNA repair exonuclease SbcCD ATPase subunit
VKFAADTAYSDYAKAVRKAREDIQTLESLKSRMIAEHRIALRDFDNVAVVLADKRKERDELVFNNTLVKKIKAARPIVAAKLWSMVLSSVSVMFSSMRGEQSIVTKGTKGFLINDRPHEALSGSALDLLGFAIRVAMLKTFIPDCSFLILDEATAACDDDRTASLLGFIASAGFPQTLLVTHEQASESVADNVVVI